MARPRIRDFDEYATIFADYGKTLRGFVRYKLTQQNLEPYIKKHMHVLDIGGGSGPYAGWLARMGHTVTLLEPSEKQREYAKRRFNFFLREVGRQKLKIVPKTLEEFTGKEKYDLVLVHGVAIYQPNPREFIKAAAERLKKGGILSLVEKGYYGAEARAIERKDLQALKELRRTLRSLDLVGFKTYAFPPEYLEYVLENDCGLEVLQWCGVRLLTDSYTERVTRFTPEELADIIEVESEHGQNPAIRGQGQLLHFIARKNS